MIQAIVRAVTVQRRSLAAAIVMLTVANEVTLGSCVEDVEEKYCRFFDHFEVKRRPLDNRIAERLLAKTSDDGRSIALVVGINEYPNLRNASIEAARVDVANLVSFLRDDQQFDEIIVLRNADATPNNIRFFLDAYVPRRVAAFNSRTRFLFAYTGHGIPANQTIPPSLVLGAARSVSDTENLYGLGTLRTSLENLARSNFHVLALINACYGGTVFGGYGGGGNPTVSDEPGSYALTAGPADMVVASLGGPGDGSIFFDEILRGVKTGDADRDYRTIVDATGSVVQRGGVVRLGPLSSYVTTQIEALAPLQLSNGAKVKLKAPWIGPVEPVGGVARGAFFFLSPVARLSNDGAEVAVPVGPRSSIAGRPELKVFGAPDEYPVRGLDISRFEGNISWPKVYKAGFQFVYIRAQDSARMDERFKVNWVQSGAAGLDRGAYLVYSYCNTVERQLKSFLEIVPGDANLPPAIDVETQEGKTGEATCARGMNDLTIRANVFALAEGLFKSRGKIPIIYGNRRMLARLNDSGEFNKYMVWLASYTASGQPDPSRLHLEGANPWTLWQYSAKTEVPGIGDNVDASVFFGTINDYNQFKAASTNVALQETTAALIASQP